MEKEVMEQQQAEQIKLKKIEVEVEKEIDTTLKTIKADKTTDKIEKIYFIPKNYAKMVAGGFARGFLMYGNAGIGKTYQIKRAFLEADKKFVCLSGHITSLKLHDFLYEHRKENVILDDVNILENEKNLNLLKSALANESRVVEYETTSKLIKAPNRFVFEGTITILINSIPKSCESLVAVESRILHHELILSYEDKMEVLGEIAKIKPYEDLTEKERLEIYDFIKENTNEATENLSLRLLFTCYNFYRYNKDIWKEFAKKQIITNADTELILQGLSEWKWTEKTGKHRATYYRIKRNLPKKNCACGNKMNFDSEICITCEEKKTRERNAKWEKESKEREKQREIQQAERNRKEKALFVIWKKEKATELKEVFEENKEEMEIDFEEFCEMSFHQRDN